MPAVARPLGSVGVERLDRGRQDLFGTEALGLRAVQQRQLDRDEHLRLKLVEPRRRRGPGEDACGDEPFRGPRRTQTG